MISWLLTDTRYLQNIRIDDCTSQKTCYCHWTNVKQDGDWYLGEEEEWALLLVWEKPLGEKAVRGRCDSLV